MKSRDQLPLRPVNRPVDRRLDDQLVECGRQGRPLDGLVIDAHGHCGTWSEIYFPRTDLASIVSVMDRCGVRALAISALLGIGPDYREGNKVVAAAADAFPGRFIGYIAVNPNYPGNEVEIELDGWLTGHRWMRGIKLHPARHRYPVTGPRYRVAFEAAARFGVPLLSHTHSEGEAAEFCCPSLFPELAEAFPTVPIIIAHSGLTPPGYRAAIEVARRYPNVYLETSGSFQAMGLLEYLVDEVGAEKVLFGSDVNYLCLPAELGRVVYAKLSMEEKRSVLGLNAARLFRFEAS